MYLVPMGDTAPATSPSQAFSLRDAINSEPVSTASAILLTYHGYARTGSLFWALVWGALGKWKPMYTVPVAVAQGLGQKKACPP